MNRFVKQLADETDVLKKLVTPALSLNKNWTNFRPIWQIMHPTRLPGFAGKVALKFIRVRTH